LTSYHREIILKNRAMLLNESQRNGLSEFKNRGSVEILQTWHELCAEYRARIFHGIRKELGLSDSE